MHEILQQHLIQRLGKNLDNLDLVLSKFGVGSKKLKNANKLFYFIRLI